MDSALLVSGWTKEDGAQGLQSPRASLWAGGKQKDGLGGRGRWQVRRLAQALSPDCFRWSRSRPVRPAEMCGRRLEADEMGRRGRVTERVRTSPPGPQPLTSSAPSLVTHWPSGWPSVLSFPWMACVRCSGCWGRGRGRGGLRLLGRQTVSRPRQAGRQALKCSDSSQGGFETKSHFIGVREGP